MGEEPPDSRAPRTVAARLRGVFPGWWVVGGAMTMQGTISGLFLQAFGAYAPFWMAEFGWSRTTLSLAYALHRTESGLLGPLHGWLLKRVSPRRVITAGVLMLGLGFVALSQVHSFAAFLTVFLMQAIGASLCGLLSLMTVLVNWFQRHRTTALGLMQTGMSLGGLAVPLVALGLTGFGWRTMAIVSGVLVLMIGLPVARLMHRDPALVGLHPDGVTPSPQQEGGDAGTRQQAAAASDQIAARAALRTRAFWSMSFGHAAAVAAVAAISVHFVLFSVETLSLSVALAATLYSLMTLVAMAGQALGGVLGDRLDKRLLATIGMAGHAAALLILSAADSMGAVVIAAVLHGAAWGIRGPLMGALRADYFGNVNFSTVMGFSSMIVMLGSVGGPLLVGILVDATGTYRQAFLAVAAVVVAGSAGFWTLAKPEVVQQAHAARNGGRP